MLKDFTAKVISHRVSSYQDSDVVSVSEDLDSLSDEELIKLLAED